jgi:hypothetical protein
MVVSGGLSGGQLIRARPFSKATGFPTAVSASSTLALGIAKSLLGFSSLQ